MAEDDCDGWKALTDSTGQECQLVGDDLFVTNVVRLDKRNHQEGIANSILIKVNQIGSLTETLAAVEMAKSAGYKSVMSHRSGETGGYYRSLIWRSPLTAARSKPAHCHGLIGWRSIISSLGSKNIWEAPPCTQARKFFGQLKPVRPRCESDIRFGQIETAQEVLREGSAFRISAPES